MAVIMYRLFLYHYSLLVTIGWKLVLHETLMAETENRHWQFSTSRDRDKALSRDRDHNPAICSVNEPQVFSICIYPFIVHCVVDHFKW